MPAVEALLDRAFGTDRHGRTAYLLRHGTTAIPGLCFVAERQGEVLGSLQCWPVEVRDDQGASPLVLLGPVGVEPSHQGEGIGKALMRAALDAADHMDAPSMLLIGDEPYYGRFGFHAAPTQGWDLPGPFERHRLLVRVRAGDRLPRTGSVGPRQSATA